MLTKPQLELLGTIIRWPQMTVGGLNVPEKRLATRLCKAGLLVRESRPGQTEDGFALTELGKEAFRVAVDKMNERAAINWKSIFKT